MSNNPLIHWPDLPNGAPPLDAVKPAHFLPALKHAIAKAETDIKAIRDNASNATFENTVEALEFARARVSRVTAVFTNIVAVKNNDELMIIGADVNAELARFNNALMTDAALFARIKAVHDAPDAALDSEQKMLLKRTWNSFVRSGALLGDDAKIALGELDEQLAGLTTTFQNNVMKAMDAYKRGIDAEEDLAGVPDRVKNILRQAAEEEGQPGKWLVRLLPPPYDLLAHADNRALRREIYEAMNGIASDGPHDNRQTIIDIARMRHDRALLLGDDSHAAYVLDYRMAKDVATVTDFLYNAEQAYRPHAEKHLPVIATMALKTS